MATVKQKMGHDALMMECYGYERKMNLRAFFLYGGILLSGIGCLAGYLALMS